MGAREHMLNIFNSTHTHINTHGGAPLSACYLLAQGHAATQSAGKADDLGHERLEGEVLLEHDSSQNGLHLWNTRTCEEEEAQAAVERVSLMKNPQKAKKVAESGVYPSRVASKDQLGVETRFEGSRWSILLRSGPR